MESTTLSKKDQEVFELLNISLEEDEEIEGFVEVQPLNMPCLLVFTNKQIILHQAFSAKILKQQKTQQIAFTRYLVEDVSFEKLNSRIKLFFFDDTLSLRVKNWKARKAAQQMAENFQNTKVDQPDPQQLLADLKVLENNFGIIQSAISWLERVRGAYGEKSAFEELLHERRLSLRVAAGIVAAYVSLNLLNDVLYGFELNYLFDYIIFYGVTGWLIFGLLTFRSNARWWAIIVSLIPFIFSVIGLFSGGDLLWVVFDAILPGLLLLVLGGKPKRGRTLAGGLLFLLLALIELLLSVLNYLYQVG